MQFTYHKYEKLKSRKLIKLLFEDGKKTTIFPIRLMYLKVDHESKFPIQAGVTVSKKSFKKAVDRNRIKRLLRETYRLNKPFLYQKLIKDVDLKESKYIFMFIYLGKKEFKYLDLEEKMKKLLDLFFSNEKENLKKD